MGQGPWAQVTASLHPAGNYTISQTQSALNLVHIYKRRKLNDATHLYLSMRSTVPVKANLSLILLLLVLHIYKALNQK